MDILMACLLVVTVGVFFVLMLKLGIILNGEKLTREQQEQLEQDARDRELEICACGQTLIPPQFNAIKTMRGQLPIYHERKRCYPAMEA